EELADEAVAMAHRLGDRQILVFALALGQLASAGPDTTRRGLEWIETLVDSLGEAGDSTSTLAARSRRIDLLLEVDDLAEADIALETLARLADASRDRRAAAYVPLHRARRFAMQGRFDEARELTAAAAATAEAIGAGTISLLTASQSIVHTWLQQGLGGVAQLVRPYADRLPAMPAYRAALTAALAAEGRTAEAHSEFERLAIGGFRTIPRDNLWLLAMALLAEACAALRDGLRADELRALLAPVAERNIVSPAAVYAGPVELWLGILAGTAGHDTEALEHLRAARVSAARAGARAVAVRIDVEEAEALGRLGERGDGDGSGGLPERARSQARELGMPHLLARIERPGSSPAPVASAPRPAEAPVASEHEGVLRREGDVWTFAWDDHLVRLKDGSGVQLLSLLLEHPGREIHCLELIALRDGRAPGGVASGEDAVVDSGQGSAGPVLDATAKAAYRARVQELREEIDEAEAFNDPERVARAREEMELVARELAGAVGLGGRDRPTGSHAERARVNATRAIRSTLKRLADYDAGLGRELETSVRTGTFCAYEPDPRRPVRWVVQRD
ncbi:MAG: hypothetical protein H0T43_05770, partial [Solirubrobacterales bacterium]|nr:hypothetical protein [Solirubrobacterales bacterium]